MKVGEDELRARVAAFLASEPGRFRPWALDRVTGLPADPEDPASLSPQRDFVRAAGTHRSRIFRGGNRTGKTKIGAIDAALRVSGWHPHKPYPDGRAPHGWVVGLDWKFGVGAILWPALRAAIPADSIAGIRYHRVAEPSIAETIVGKAGWRIDFKSAEAGRTKMQSASLDWAWIDEEPDEDVVEEIETRLLDRGGDLVVTVTPLRRERWVRKLEVREGTFVAQASTLDAARALAPVMPNMYAAVKALADNLPERQRKVRIFGQHAALEGLVYPEFSRARNVLRPRGDVLVDEAGRIVAPWPIPPEWQRFAAIDFGYSNPTSVVLAAVNPANGVVIVPRVYHAAYVRGTVWAEFLKATLPPLTSHLVADHDADERAEFLARGLGTQAAKKDVIPGLECVERYIGASGKPPRLYLVVEDPPPRIDLVGRCDAMPLLLELEAYHYPKKKDDEAPDRKDLPEKVDDHAADALRYLLVLIEGRYGGPPTISTSDEALAPEAAVAEAAREAAAARTLWTPDSSPRRQRARW